LNPGPTAPESSALTTRLLSHPYTEDRGRNDKGRKRERNGRRWAGSQILINSYLGGGEKKEKGGGKKKEKVMDRKQREKKGKE